MRRRCGAVRDAKGYDEDGRLRARRSSALRMPRDMRLLPHSQVIGKPRLCVKARSSRQKKKSKTWLRHHLNGQLTRAANVAGK